MESMHFSYVVKDHQDRSCIGLNIFKQISSFCGEMSVFLQTKQFCAYRVLQKTFDVIKRLLQQPMTYCLTDKCAPPPATLIIQDGCACGTASMFLW